MSLELDERRTAMLSEMGLRLFQPSIHVLDVVSAPPEPRRQLEGKPAPAAGVAQAAAKAPAIVTVQAPVALSAHAAGIETMHWDALAEAVAGCRACKLSLGRRNTVFGVGDQRADWLIVGEAPDESEDLQGAPFAGQAGTLLDNMLKSMGLNREKVHILNVVRCRPPGNRNPEPDELAQCGHFLKRQVQLRVILAMGRFAVQALLNTAEPLGQLRGRPHQYHGVPVVVTYHPAKLIRNLPDKAKAWSDLCLAMDLVAAQPAA
jgi:uracil-DNA glycosylase family 4